MRKPVFLASLLIIANGVSGMNWSGGHDFENNRDFYDDNFEQGQYFGREIDVSHQEEFSEIPDNVGIWPVFEIDDNADLSTNRKYREIKVMNEDEAEILTSGDCFSDVQTLKIDASLLSNIPLDKISFPQLTKLNVCNMSNEYSNELGKLIEKTSPTLLNLSIQRSINSMHRVLEQMRSDAINGNLDDNQREELKEKIASIWERYFGVQQPLNSMPESSKRHLQIPASVWNCERLVRLNLYNCGLNSLTSEIGRLVNLEALDLSDNELTELPIEIGLLTKLTYLDVRLTKINNFPSEVRNLKSLETVKLDRHVSIWRFINSNGEFSSSENISMEGSDSGQNTSEDPVSYEESSLGNPAATNHEQAMSEDLLFNNESLSEGSVDSDVEKVRIMAEIKKINLSGKGLIQLPLDIIMCEDLEDLDLSNNRLTEVTPLLGKLMNLKRINLCGNKEINSVKKIPGEIFWLPFLESIILTEEGQNREYGKNEIAKIVEQEISNKGEQEMYNELLEIRKQFMLPTRPHHGE